jgi:penicillin amidase
MNLSTDDLLKRLGAGERIDAICEAARITRTQFDDWWRGECRRRVPAAEGSQQVIGLHGAVRIERDRWGVPHIHADNDHELFFGFGYATAQDRLFQLDYLRRKARGQLAEILGPGSVDSDVLHRTVGIAQIAEREGQSLPADVQAHLSAYCDGINALREQSLACLPIEFDLLGYQPSPWLPTDSLAIIGEFRWYLTGRLPVIAVPELAKRTLGDGPLFRDFTLGEADDESILHPGEYPTTMPHDVGHAVSNGDEALGSNNWVLDGKRTITGKPLVANDPHIPYYAVSIWHEVRLHGGSFNVAGAALAGMPGVMIGRNERVAWGITNNICSQRDLYQEKTDPAHSGCFLFDGRWEPATEREEIINVKGSDAIRKVVRSSRHGPIVDELLPVSARHTGPVSLRWLGAEPCGWLTATIAMSRARSCDEFREAGRPWLVPTFNLVFADVEGNIGLQSVGRVPQRRVEERGYRPGWDPQHEWTGVIPYDTMPRLNNPARGYAVTANNRLAPPDFAYPLYGRWNAGYRAKRLREQIEGKPTWSLDESRLLQLDVHSGRAACCVPALIALLRDDGEIRLQQAVTLLQGWNHHIDADSAPAAIFNVFFVHWAKTVVAERFPAEQVAFVADHAKGLAQRLLQGDSNGWFHSNRREAAIRQAFVAALDELTTKLGDDMAGWSWGRIHGLFQPHFLSGIGDLGELMDRSGLPVSGDGVTVCAGTTDARHRSWLGAGYRMVADLADPLQRLWATEVASTSGHPGSPHYDDQLHPWNAGELHAIPLQGEIGGSVLTLRPRP